MASNNKVIASLLSAAAMLPAFAQEQEKPAPSCREQAVAAGALYARRTNVIEPRHTISTLVDAGESAKAGVTFHARKTETLITDSRSSFKSAAFSMDADGKLSTTLASSDKKLNNDAIATLLTMQKTYAECMRPVTKAVAATEKNTLQ